MLFISPPARTLLFIAPPHATSLYAFVITSRHKEPPIFYFTHSSAHAAVHCGPCNYHSYLLVIVYQAQRYKHPVENNGRALPQPGMTLLSQRHSLSEIVMGVIRAPTHLKQYIWTSGLPLTGSIMANCWRLDHVIISLFVLCSNNL